MPDSVLTYQVSHRTVFEYDVRIDLSHNTTCLQPRNTTFQTRRSHRLKVDPKPEFRAERMDPFGNSSSYFAVQHSHDHLDVAATSRLQVSLGTRPWEHLPEESWTDLKEDLSKVTGNGVMERLPFSLTSSHCPTAPEFANYAESSFQQYEGAFSACSALMHRIFEELDYVPGVTTVNSSVYDILQDKRGVCQDFAHLMISCLRSLGLAARYVSGYLETLPPEGQPKMKGSDASHAWVEVFLGNQGWVPFDPTNDCCPRAQHLVLAYGRDFSDVQPHYGIFTVAGYRPPKVEVDVSRM